MEKVGSRKPKRSAVHWLMMGPDPYLATCKRCGKTVDKPPLPATMGAVLKYLGYAEEAHRHCVSENPPEGRQDAQ